MMDTAIDCGFSMLAVAVFLGSIRLARGPSVMDRVMAFDLITTCVVGMIVLLSIRWRTTLYLELILIFSLLGFLTTVAFVMYLRGTAGPKPASADRGSAPSPGRSVDAPP
jgi:multisubunit Na+/H+ antiporter MnhF subunit